MDNKIVGVMVCYVNVANLAAKPTINRYKKLMESFVDMLAEQNYYSVFVPVNSGNTHIEFFKL